MDSGMFFMEKKNSEGQSRVTNQRRIQEVVILKLGEYLESEKVGVGKHLFRQYLFYYVTCV